jgi:hypothetical protein
MTKFSICEPECYWSIPISQQPMLVTVTHLYRNCSQSKTIFDLIQTVDTHVYLPIFVPLWQFMLDDYNFEHRCFETCGTT